MLAGKRAVLTGASGGIGSALARALGRAGAQLVLLGRDAGRLEHVASGLRRAGTAVTTLAIDLRRPDAAGLVAQEARRAMGGTDILVNNAGIGRFQLFEAEEPEQLEQLLALNLLAPMRLAQALLPEMLARGDGQIVNIGSTFGRLAFPGQAAYSAAKHGLRGWSEGLRRELVGTGVAVSYIAPRATRTALNDPRADALNAALGTRVDDPAAVAARIARAIAERRAELQLGWPEKLLVRVNALFPRLVDRGLAAKLATVRQHARAAANL